LTALYPKGVAFVKELFPDATYDHLAGLSTLFARGTAHAAGEK
jgi:hypothetical protein